MEELGNTNRPERVRKTSVVFDQPQVTTIGGVLNVVEAGSLSTEVAQWSAPLVSMSNSRLSFSLRIS